MSSKSIDILLNEPVVVTMGQRKISVSETDWGHLLAFADHLARAASPLLRPGADGTVQIALAFAALPEIVRSSKELSDELLAGSTGLSAEDLAALPARVVLRLLDIAIEVNFTEEFLTAGKDLAARLQGVVPGAAQAKSAASSKA